MKCFLLVLILNINTKIAYLQILYEDTEDHRLSRHLSKRIYLVWELHLFPCRFTIKWFSYYNVRAKGRIPLSLNFSKKRKIMETNLFSHAYLFKLSFLQHCPLFFLINNIRILLIIERLPNWVHGGCTMGAQIRKQKNNDQEK